MTRKPLEVDVTDFVQAVGLLIRRVRAAAASQELSLTETAVLSRLVSDGPATTADLARSAAEVNLAASVAAGDKTDPAKATP